MSRLFLKKFPTRLTKNIPYNYKYQYLKNNQFQSVKILVDEVEFDTTNPDEGFSFEDYSKAIVSMIIGSYQKFSVGIYGKWGTGKTTLMRLIEKKLRPHVFAWEGVPGKDTNGLKDFLKENFDNMNWLGAPNRDFEKNVDKNNIKISDRNTSDYLSIILQKEKRKAIVEVNGAKIYEFFVEEDRDTHNLSIKENDILTVWFNAWRYEREEQFALIPLMKTIAYAMGEHPIYKDIKPILIRGLEILSKDILRNLATRYVMTEQGFKEFEERLIPKLESLPEIDKDTIYFDGIKNVEAEIKRIFEQHPSSRIVVFIDDLDRCSPETALEVFESIKVFLDIDGFVFILGLSREALDKLIKAKYEKMGLTDIAPDEYIRKIIQIDINIQKWTDKSIKYLIGKLSNKVDEKYREQIINNSDLITEGVELNPRQVKRFVNRFIIALTVNDSLEAKKYLVGEVLNTRWYDFYGYITNPDFVKVLDSYLKKRKEAKGEEFLAQLENKARDKDHPLNEFEKIILSYKDDSALWDFIENYRDTIFGQEIEGVIEESNIAKDWQKYQSVSGSTNIHIPTVQEVQAISPFVFISMPLREELNILYAKGIIPALTENGLVGRRMDSSEAFVGDITEHIKEAIESASLVIAVVSDNNPNVSFELGYASALKKLTILLAKSMDEVPFNFRTRQVILYRSPSDLRKSLSKTLAELRARGII